METIQTEEIRGLLLLDNKGLAIADKFKVTSVFSILCLSKVLHSFLIYVFLYLYQVNEIEELILNKNLYMTFLMIFSKRYIFINFNMALFILV